MSSPPPTKPPRGVKQGKETSGLLMSVIRTLSASETNEQREKERAKLEKEYKKSDARLDELVAAHAQEIMEVMQKFSNVGAALTVWGQHCDAAVARLAACRGLLQLRRDDLKRLWADSRTHHYALQMLTDIESVVVSERVVREAMSSGRVLSAAYTLSTALSTAEQSLNHVHALNTTRQHLKDKKHELVDTIVKRMNVAVYHSERAPLSRRVSARRRTALLLAELTKSEEVTDAYLQEITPEFEASLSEEDKTFETTVMISLEALGVLEQLKEAAEKFKVQIQTELLEVIESVSRRIMDENDIEESDSEFEQDGETSDAEGETETSRPLVNLLVSLGDELKAAAQRNRRLLQLWRATLQKYKVSDSCLHTEQHYWSAVQQVLQLLLTDYLEIESVNIQRTSTTTTLAPSTELRISDYFAKKKPQRRRPKLFKVTSAGSAGAPPARTDAARRLVCAPSPAHLHAALPALHALTHHVEQATRVNECSLRAFITDYVRSGYTERLSAMARNEIETICRSPSAWRERTAPKNETNKNVGERHATVFSCACACWAAARRCVRAARRAGDLNSATTAALACIGLQCRAAHGRLVPGAARSARWLADDDIVRFLRSLPNWTNQQHTQQELAQAFEREAEILGSSLGDGVIQRREIISDTGVLSDIAVMCETADWLSTNIKSIPSILSGPGGTVKPSEKFLNDIASAALIFDEISNKCLLLLHLELRIQCFYYVGSEALSAEPGESELDSETGGAARLARSLIAFHEQTANVLAPSRLAYVLNGIGEMMSSAIVYKWQGTTPAAGGAALAALRHGLAALALPHAGLQRASRYLQLLDATPEDIIESVREKGPQFSELEYLNALKIIGSRRGLSQNDMKAHLKALSSALGHVGVTV